MHVEHNVECEPPSCLRRKEVVIGRENQNMESVTPPSPPSIPFQNYPILKSLFFTDITFSCNYVLV